MGFLELLKKHYICQSVLKKTMKKFFIFFILFYIGLNAQNPAEYDKLYKITYLETSQKDFKSALNTADSLFVISETPYFQAKSLMLTASLYQNSGDLKKSVEYALLSEKILEKTDNGFWKARVYGFLATQYRILKLDIESHKYAQKAIEISKKIKDPESANSTAGLMSQEMAYYEIEKKNYKKSIDYIHQSQHYFNVTNIDKAYFTATNEQLLGLNYSHLKEYDKAITHYQKALHDLRNIPENSLTGLIHNGLAEIYIEKKEEKKAKKHLDLAQKISEQSDFLALKNKIYETSQKYYVLIKDVTKIVETKIKQDVVVEQILEKRNTFINESYAKLDKKNESIEKEISYKNTIILLCSLVMLLGMIYFVYNRRKQKKNIGKFKQIMKDLEEKLQHKQDITLQNTKVDYSEKSAVGVSNATRNSLKDVDCLMMTAETEQKIVENLEKFENSVLFTDNAISLSYLATYCDTNTKYLSYLINNHRKKDFNNYINELRINYIIEKLKTIPRYRKYKIAVLAEEAGFSSQNKFATVFKKETSIPPSLFIKYLNEEFAEPV